MVGYLVHDPNSLTPEEQAGWNFLSKQRGLRCKTITFDVIRQRPYLLRKCNVLWWHFDSSLELPSPALHPRVLAVLRRHIERGNGLLLSLLASQYTVDLGLEEIRPNVVLRGEWSEKSWAEDCPDIRGFASYQGHPVFEGFLGGLYTWCPAIGQKYSAAYYENAVPRNGSVVAVERLYISIDERRRSVVEYSAGKGKVLTIGSHFYFDRTGQRFRKHLEQFANNCLLYLPKKARGGGKLKAAPQRGTRRTYWTFDQRTVERFEHKSKPVGKTTHTLVVTPSDLIIERTFTAAAQEEHYFDLGGRRILIEGKERGGISEVWCHPIRTLRDLKAGFKIGDSPVQWSETLSPTVVIRPELLKRIYSLGDTTIEETVFADLKKPGGEIHYHVKSPHPVELVISSTIDLRMMWPLSEEATGSLKYSWDTGLRAGIITGHDGELVTVLGTSLEPREQIVGQYSNINVEADKLAGTATDVVQVAVGFRLTLTNKQSRCVVAFAGSHQGKEEAIRVYRALVKNPASALRAQVTHFRSLEKRSTRIMTPDVEFNEGYRWALAATDRFFVETPHLGASFVAGYGPSTSGWGGGHAISGRPGYAWYFGRDSVWTSFAALGYGDFEKVRSVLEFLGNHQDINGKILHELTTSGHAHYDAADATPLYVILMGRYLRASADLAFVKKEYPRLVKAIEYCFSTDTDGDHLIENTNVGHGWVEGGRLFPVHTEHYLACCWAQALEEASCVASSLKRHLDSGRWRRESHIVKDIIRREFWNPETGFYNFGKYADGRFNAEKTILPTVGMYFDRTERGKLDRCLREYASENFSADWGVRIVGKDNRMFDPTGYHYGSIWPLFTGWTSLAEFAVDRPLQGFMHLMSNLVLYKYFSAGYVEEVLHGEKFQPAGVCPHQAWSETMVLQPILEGMLGLERDAHGSTLTLRPYFPPHWNFAEIKNIRLGDHFVHVKMRREKGSTSFEFRTSASSGIGVTLQPRFPLGTFVWEVVVGSERIKKKTRVTQHWHAPEIKFLLSKHSEVRFHHSGGIAIVPPVPRLRPNQESEGLRIIEERSEDGAYVVILEGRPERRYTLDVIDPFKNVKEAAGAEIVNREGSRLTLALKMGQTGTANNYVRKQVLLLTR